MANKIKIIESAGIGKVNFGIGFGVRICSFALMQKNQKIKAASAELLRHCVSLCAPQTRYAQTATLRPLHFVPSLNDHQNEAETIDN